MRQNKNRLCSKTCGGENTKKRKEIKQIIEGIINTTKESMVEKKNMLKTLDPTPKRNLIRKRQIPPRREIWSKSLGSHPERNLGWENRMKKSEVDLGKKKLTLAFKVMTSK